MSAAPNSDESAESAESAETASTEASWPWPAERVEGTRDGFWASCEAKLLTGLLGTLGRLPAGLQNALIGGLAQLCKWVDRRHTSQAREFLRTALGDSHTATERERLIVAAYAHLFRQAFENERFDACVDLENWQQHYEFELSEDMRRLRDSGSGAMLITAHVGAWEAFPPFTARLGFRPLYVVSRPPKNRPLSRYAQAQREARGFRLLPRHGAAQALPKILEAGGFVGLVLDQRARKKTVLAPFFGRLAHCERGVAVIAKRCRKPIAFGVCYRKQQPWRYRAVFDPVLWPEEIAQLSVEELVTRINREFERMILAYPDQYLWLHDRYRKAPTPDGPGAEPAAAR